jgi:hypothetical protein
MELSINGLKIKFSENRSYFRQLTSYNRNGSFLRPRAREFAS